MTHRKLRDKFKIFWESAPRNHRLVPPGSLVLQNDATTLFTSSGMQPLVPYLTGEAHQSGKRLYNIQPCIRTQDIDEVGNNRHTTFFEMMGNWSLGDYFKEEQLPWMWEFFTQELGLPEKKLYVTIFEGGSGVAKDNETYQIWKKLGIPEERISFYGAENNWWSRSGPPDKMPAGEIGGPATEVFYDFGEELGLHEKSTFKDKKCHPNCDCGRFLEIGNSVFIQYKMETNGSLAELSQKNVDYGGGIERILAAVNNNPDIFQIDILNNIIAAIEKFTGLNYSDQGNQASMRIIADHIRAAIFLIIAGVVPANKEHGYVLRRMLRRSAVKIHFLCGEITPNFYSTVSLEVLSTYDGLQGINKSVHQPLVESVVNKEMIQFTKTLDKGLRKFEKKQDINESIAFELYQSYGFPFEIIQELAKQKGVSLDEELFDQELRTHKDLSRSASAGKFKGGLADHSDQVLKYHTATHLLHQALKDVFGPTARQEGSNITQERLRFDVQLDRKPTDGEIKQVEGIVNQKIVDGLEVQFKIMPRQEADRIGAASFFNEKYGDEVKVYFIGDYSKEFCGGPHVSNTEEIGKIRISKVKKIGSKLIRLYVERDSLIQ